MYQETLELRSRAARYVPKASAHVRALIEGGGAAVDNISSSGLALSLDTSLASLRRGSVLRSVRVVADGQVLDCGPATVTRTQPSNERPGTRTVGIAFRDEQTRLIERLLANLKPYEYVTGELARTNPEPEPGEDVTERTLDQFHRLDDGDVFAKCRSFGSWVAGMQSSNTYQRLYRVTLTGGIDNHVTVFDPQQRRERVMICFDSNSYLGLHRHPRVIEEVTRVTNLVGYGTPSAQLLCGTNRYLRELEQALAEFHGREDTLVFPTGFAANVGALHALLRDNDAVVRDRHAHASIHEGCRTSSARVNKIFAHNKPESLDRVLALAENVGCAGKVVVTDGVFSMHGSIAPLPELVEVCRRRGARLMVDDAHGVGVIGATGRGIEEHFDTPGVVDILMGTLSKALGAVGGYVCGSRDLIDYLRWFAPSGLFTTTLPAPVCAGVKTALELVRSEPEHRSALWHNIEKFGPALRAAGFITSDPVSPIVTVFIGTQALLWDISRALWDAGIKCGNVIYPAVGKADCILRFTVNARHTAADLDHAIDTLTGLGRAHGILWRTREEIQEIGRARGGRSPESTRATG